VAAPSLNARAPAHPVRVPEWALALPVAPAPAVPCTQRAASPREAQQAVPAQADSVPAALAVLVDAPASAHRVLVAQVVPAQAA